MEMLWKWIKSVKDVSFPTDQPIMITNYEENINYRTGYGDIQDSHIVCSSKFSSLTNYMTKRESPYTLKISSKVYLYWIKGQVIMQE